MFPLGKPQTLGHVISGPCDAALHEGRFTWRHDSIVLCIARMLASINQSNTVYADTQDKLFPSPSTITGDDLRPDIVLVKDSSVYILELTVGFETNLERNAIRKREKYKPLLKNLKKSYENVSFLNMSMGAIGTFGKSCANVTEWLGSVGVNESASKNLLRKLVNISLGVLIIFSVLETKNGKDPN